jgi:hypothetical protein
MASASQGSGKSEQATLPVFVMELGSGSVCILTSCVTIKKIQKSEKHLKIDNGCI